MATGLAGPLYEGKEGFELIYSFDKDHILLNLKLAIPEDEEIMSITGVYWSAFIYENEMQDLA